MKLNLVCLGLLALVPAAGALAGVRETPRWKIHDLARPKPRVVTPPPQKLPLPPPPDALVLFDGDTGLSHFAAEQGGPPKWAVKEDVLTVVPGAGGIVSKRAFGDVQIHLEWASPSPATGHSQGRGNSGIHLMGRYEVQILDSYKSDTYADGQAGALYGQHPPLVNACRPPGEWQSYDIVFRRPRFDAKGSVLKPARVTVLHNGVLVQDNSELLGPTLWLHYQPYEAHADRLPFSLQEHGNAVRFRNLWVRELPEIEPSAALTAHLLPLDKAAKLDLKRYLGTYVARMGNQDREFTITSRAGRIYFNIPFRNQAHEIFPVSDREFALRATDARLKFDLDADGRATGFAFSVAGDVALTPKRAK